MGAESDEADTTGKRLKGVRCEKRSEQRVMRRYSVLGISLMDFSAREGLRRAEHFLQTGASTGVIRYSSIMRSISITTKCKLIHFYAGIKFHGC